MGEGRISVIRIALFTALVYVATIVFQVYTPATRGYFNLGETAIYTVAALLPPLASGLAAGVGSAIADLTTGYGYFAPGTLVIKFTEGFMASYLMRKLAPTSRRGLAKALSILASVLTGAVMASVGYFRLSGISEITSIPIQVGGHQVIAFYGKIPISGAIWIGIGVFVTSVLLYAVLVKGRENVSAAASMLVGGLFMVLGYFLYEFFFTNPIIYHAPPIQALAEVPVNFGQVLVGITVALPIASFLREARGLSIGGKD